jgi:Flp pilus assembly pilin Flp
MHFTTCHRLNHQPHALTLSEDERGLTTVEYVILLVLIAVGAIGSWRTFGGSINAKISDSTKQIDTLSGNGNGNGQTNCRGNSAQPANPPTGERIKKTPD